MHHQHCRTQRTYVDVVLDGLEWRLEVVDGLVQIDQVGRQVHKVRIVFVDQLAHGHLEHFEEHVEIVSHPLQTVLALVVRKEGIYVECVLFAQRQHTTTQVKQHNQYK